MNLQSFIGQWLRPNSQRNPNIPTRKTGIPVGFLQEYVGECKKLMFFGLINSPATFQTMMNDIFTDMISEGVVVVYLDNILIFTKDLDEHWQVTHRVLGRLAVMNMLCPWPLEHVSERKKSNA